MLYLKVDLTMPNPYGKLLWLPGMEYATEFASEADAEAAKKATPDATGVIQGWYVVKH